MSPSRSGPAFAGRSGSDGVLRAAFLGTAALLAVVAAAPAAAADRSATWEAASGQATFVLHTFWHDVEGSTARVTGSLTSAAGDPLADGVVKISVEAATLDTGNAKRDRNMREQFLETAKYPLLEFHSTAPPVRKGDSVTIEGDLTIHGVTKKVSVDVEAKPAGGEWAMKTAFNVKLSDHAIPDPSIAFNKVKDEVNVGLEIRFRRVEGR